VDTSAASATRVGEPGFGVFSKQATPSPYLEKNSRPLRRKV
jgi:hypothetical protein